MTDRRIAIARPEASDAATLSELAKTAFTQTYGPHNTEADLAAHLDKTYSLAAVEANFAASDLHYVMATVDEEAAGFGLVAVGSACESVSAGHPAEVKHLYVLESFQRLRLGWRLMDECCHIAQASGCDALWLGVWEQAHWARRFYERYGMKNVGTIEFTLVADLQTDIVMSLPLAPAG